jgi:hypothetical protein
VSRICERTKAARSNRQVVGKFLMAGTSFLIVRAGASQKWRQLLHGTGSYEERRVQAGPEQHFISRAICCSMGMFMFARVQDAKSKHDAGMKSWQTLA